MLSFDFSRSHFIFGALGYGYLPTSDAPGRTVLGYSIILFYANKGTWCLTAFLSLSRCYSQFMTLVSVWKCVCDGVEGARAADRGHVIELVMIEFIDTHSPNHLAFKGPLSNGHGLQEGRWISRIVSVG